MVVMRRISGAGRGLLVLGAALLLVSLFGNLVFPSTYVAWFTLSGNQPQLPAGAYTGIQVTELLNTLVSGPYLWIAFGSLLVSAAAAIAQPFAMLIPTTHAAQLAKYYFGLIMIPGWQVALGWAYLLGFAALMGFLASRRAHWVDP